MKIFITGGTGFIGTYLVKKLQKRGHLLYLLSCNLAEPEKWKREVENFKPEAAIHLAWEGLPDYSAKTSIKNLKYGLELFNLLAEIGCKTILSIGSCWEYGQQQGKLSEDMAIKPFNAFSTAKNALNWLGKEIAKENGIQFIWPRIFYVYGPGQRETSLIPYLINCAQKKETPQIKSLSAKNDFIYIEDVVEAITLLLEKCKQGGVYNIGSGKLTMVKEVVGIINEEFNLRKQYKNISNKTKEILTTNFYADLSKIKKDINWKPKVSIEEGIKKTIQYYKNQK